jgi:hypothetical protein
MDSGIAVDSHGSWFEEKLFWVRMYKENDSLELQK